ncbi:MULTISPECIES: hypothetical protein [Citricoccus]|uniref:Lipoprotein antigen n=1 Tax=Citricoccus muralis TaxID=169134 RepID=A0ABY8H6D1_9MICC|nr:MULTISPECIES: hypothetical protein [Citricoccus]WBL19806.1 hypothetical protein O1A05_03680 [Citricoccus sp. NR2]WFP16699.1 hypothetical protein P8192_00805 [Citricoccus muralis]
MRFTRILTVAVAAAAATTLVACSGGDDVNDAAANTDAGEQKVIEMPDQPGSVEGYVGAADDAELVTCDPQGSALEVEGTVTNPESDDQDYRVYISAMEGGETMGIVQVDVSNVATGETAEWSTEMALTGDDLECVLRVERF